ncbi:hypothetical protein N7490_006612 [Penicillium lividum]|nr:hypothetical protein N7490_006612 [Penicillium lividum]
MANTMSRVKQEQLRKRRNNLLRRHNDFWRLYNIKSWLIMEMPDGRIFTYRSHPDIAAPTKKEMVQRPHPTVHRTPSDYIAEGSAQLVVKELPVFLFPCRQDAVWTRLSQHLKRYNNCTS